MRVPPATCLARRRGTARVAAVAVILSYLNGCAVKSWRPASITPASAGRILSPGKTARIPTTDSIVALRIVRLAYPCVEGVPEPGSGPVAFPIGRVVAEVRTLSPGKATFVTLSPEDVTRAPERLVDRDVQFLTTEGKRLALHVQALEDGIVRGVPIACWGDAGARCTATILVDLSQTTRISVRGIDWRGVGGNLTLLGILALVSFLVWAFFWAFSHLD